MYNYAIGSYNEGSYVLCEVRNVAEKTLKRSRYTIEYDFCGRFSFTLLRYVLDINLNLLVGHGKYYISLIAKYGHI